MAMLQTEPTDGPVDPDLNATRFHKIFFPTEPGSLPVQYNDMELLYRYTSGLFYTNPTMYTMMLYPNSNNKLALMRVWTLRELEPGTRDDATRENWPSYEAYRYDLHNRSLRLNRRLSGVLLTTFHGKIEYYRVLVGGATYRIVVDSPDPVTELLTLNNITGPGGRNVRWSAVINPAEIVFEPSQVVSDWMPLHKAGLLAINTLVPHSVLSRIYVRFRLSNRHRAVTNIKLVIEGFIVPRDDDERVRREMRQDYKDMLSTANCPTFTFWVGDTNLKWDVVYPTLPRVFNTKWPVPAINELAQNCNVRPNEYQIRRVMHDILFKAGGGKPMHRLVHFDNWIRDPNREYFINRIPTLILPHFNPPVMDVDRDYAFLNPGQRQQEETNDTNRMEWTPLISQLVNRFETRARISTYSGGQYDSTDWNNITQVDPSGLPLPHSVSGKTPSDAEGKNPGLRLQLTAGGKHRSQRDTKGLSQTYMSDHPDLKKEEAEILAQVTQAGISDNTARAHKSMRKSIQKLFPERDEMFLNNKEGDQLLIVSRMMYQGYKPRTVLSYLANYDRLVLDAGGKHYPKPPALPKIMIGLKNLNHDPAAHLSNPSRTAYSIDSLQLVAIRGATLMEESGKWSQFKAALFRVTCVLLFFGRLRSAEALMDKNSTADILTDLLLKDVVFSKNEQGNVSHVTLWLRNAKYKER